MRPHWVPRAGERTQKREKVPSPLRENMGAWVTPSVEGPTLDFDSHHDLGVVGLSPALCPKLSEGLLVHPPLPHTLK